MAEVPSSGLRFLGAGSHGKPSHSRVLLWCERNKSPPQDTSHIEENTAWASSLKIWVPCSHRPVPSAKDWVGEQHLAGHVV